MIKRAKCNIPMCTLPGYTSGLSLPPNDEFIIIADYPLEKAFNFKISTNDGMDLLEIYNCIGRIYKEIYKDPDKYGVWGHDRNDLFLESVTIDYDKKTIMVGMGS